MCSNSADRHGWTDIEGSPVDPETESTDGTISRAPCPDTALAFLADDTTQQTTGDTCERGDADECDGVRVLCSSSSSSVCRICQETRTAADEALDTCHCLCKGHLANVHRSCLLEWIHYRGSNRCEICNGTFHGMPTPGRLGVNQVDSNLMIPSPPEFRYYQTLEALRHQLSQLQPLSRRKRTAVAGVIVFLLLVIAVTSILTIGANQDFQSTNNNPYATIGEKDKAHIVLSICIAFLFFCITMALGLALMWMVLECYFYVHRRRILQRAAERLIRDSNRSRQSELSHNAV